MPPDLTEKHRNHLKGRTGEASVMAKTLKTLLAGLMSNVAEIKQIKNHVSKPIFLLFLSEG